MPAECVSGFCHGDVVFTGKNGVGVAVEAATNGEARVAIIKKTESRSAAEVASESAAAAVTDGAVARGAGSAAAATEPAGAPCMYCCSLVTLLSIPCYCPTRDGCRDCLRTCWKYRFRTTYVFFPYLLPQVVSRMINQLLSLSPHAQAGYFKV